MLEHEGAILEGIWRDFDALRSKASNWDDDTAVGPESFDLPLWPQGAPDGWPSDERLECSLPRNAGPDVSGLIPTGTKRALATGAVLYTRVTTQGRLWLKAPRGLYLEEVRVCFKSGGKDAESTVQLIDLVAESEGSYGPEHSHLVYYPDLGCFGQYDDDHKVAMIFSGVSWEEIMFDSGPDGGPYNQPARYLNALQTNAVGEVWRP